MVHHGCGVVIAEHLEPPWLPTGGRAVVVRGGLPQQPMCLVRLLLRRGDSVFCIPRDGEGKLDLPTTAVAHTDRGAADAVDRLMGEIVGAAGDAQFLGAVRNIVESPARNYPWPQPDAFFGVWALDAEPMVDGAWVHLADRDTPLRERHWFPLLC